MKYNISINYFLLLTSFLKHDGFLLRQQRIFNNYSKWFLTKRFFSKVSTTPSPLKVMRPQLLPLSRLDSVDSLHTDRDSTTISRESLSKVRSCFWAPAYVLCPGFYYDRFDGETSFAAAWQENEDAKRALDAAEKEATKKVSIFAVKNKQSPNQVCLFLLFEILKFSKFSGSKQNSRKYRRRTTCLRSVRDLHERNRAKRAVCWWDPSWDFRSCQEGHHCWWISADSTLFYIVNKDFKTEKIAAKHLL